MQNSLKAVFVLIISLLVALPAVSYADWHNGNNNGNNNGNWHGNGQHNYNHYDHSYIGVNFSLWPDGYYYGAPYYPPADEVLVSPPVYDPVVINGATYYLNDGTYYLYNGYEYQAVAPPATEVPQPVQVVQPVVENQAQSIPQAAPDSITINIPNDKGGYTPVTLKKSGNGFIGPQGEFYAEFPKVAQLEVIYGK